MAPKKDPKLKNKKRVVPESAVKTVQQEMDTTYKIPKFSLQSPKVLCMARFIYNFRRLI